MPNAIYKLTIASLIEVVGDTDDERTPDDYMLLCATCNRAKSWSCEQCKNWLEDRDPTMCATCYWAQPTAYTHVAMQPERRLTLIWQAADVEQYNQLRRAAEAANETLQAYIKRLLNERNAE